MEFLGFSMNTSVEARTHQEFVFCIHAICIITAMIVAHPLIAVRVSLCVSITIMDTAGFMPRPATGWTRAVLEVL